MEWFKEWMCGITAVVIICAITKGVTPRNAPGKIVALASVVIMMFSVISPIAEIAVNDRFLSYERRDSEYREKVKKINEENEKIRCEIIENRVSEYIFSEAVRNGVPCERVDVKVHLKETNTLSINKIKIFMSEEATAQNKECLLETITTQMGIPGSVEFVLRR